MGIIDHTNTNGTSYEYYHTELILVAMFYFRENQEERNDTAS